MENNKVRQFVDLLVNEEETIEKCSKGIWNWRYEIG